jgi:hypothetical protein
MGDDPMYWPRLDRGSHSGIFCPPRSFGWRTYTGNLHGCIFGKSHDKIDEVIQSFRRAGPDGKPEFALSIEEDVFAFLGVEVTKDKGTGEVELRQLGLIDKVLKYCGMSECNTKATPCGVEPLHADKDGQPCQEKWSFAAAVGMLMYLSSNSRPDTQFAVHQCARFTHSPKRSHEVAIQRFC